MQYEMLYIISGDVADSDVESKAKLVAGILEKIGGKIKDTDILGRKTLAYKIQKQDTGTYINLIFEIDPANLPKIAKEFRTQTFILRYLFATLPARKPIIQLKPRIKPEALKAVSEVKIEKPKVEAKETEPKIEKVKTESFDSAQDKKPEKKKSKKVEIKKPKLAPSKPKKEEKSFGKVQDKTEITKDMESEEERLKKLDEKLEEILKE